MNWKLHILIFILIITPVTARSDEFSHRKAALRLYELYIPKEAPAPHKAEQILHDLNKKLISDFLDLNLPMEAYEDIEAEKKKILKWAKQVFEYDFYKNTTINIFMEFFTEEELLKLIEFYEHPLYKKLLAKSDEINLELRNEMKDSLRNFFNELLDKIEFSKKELIKKYRK